MQVIESLPFILMRGGTSKGVFLRAADVPDERVELSALLLDLFGSPDRRQIDGLGGADKLTSKAAIIGPPSVPGADLDYLFRHIDAIRREVAHATGLGEYWDSRAVPSNPMCVVVPKPASYVCFISGSEVRVDDIDLVCRQYSTGSTSKALAATVTACTGIACRIAGSIPARHLGPRAHERDLIEIGHPSGVIGVEARTSGPQGTQVDSARIFRTARRIAEGRAWLKGEA